MTSLLIGRFQPLHNGHAKLVQTLLAEGRQVVIGLRDGPISSANPYSVVERTQMFRGEFGDRVGIISIPEDGGLEVVRGRSVGWEIRELSLEPELERISATAVRAAQPKIMGQTLWFFGLPASGKTTLARKVVQHAAGYVLLDGDEVRQTVENFDMGDDARLVHLSYMAFCCRRLNECGINVAAAFVTPLTKHRDRIKAVLAGVKLIWLQCSVETCAARDPKGLWRKAAQGELPQLTGAGGAWEEPGDCTLVIRTDEMSVDQAFDMLTQRFNLVSNGRTVLPGAHLPPDRSP